MSEHYTVTNWRKFQHYKDRNPPWIKLHFEMLSSADWVMLDDTSRVLAIACMLIASRNEGTVPANPDYIKRVAYLNKTPNFKPLIDSGFLQVASGCKQMLADARPETETETETDVEGLTIEVNPPLNPKQVITKLTFGEFQNVKLTLEEYGKLEVVYGNKLENAIEILGSYIASKNKRYASHYAVMKKSGWVWDKVFSDKQYELQNPSTRVASISTDPSYN